MGVFTDRLELLQIDGEQWETSRALEYHIGDKNSDYIIKVPKGYITDLASVPWPATLFIPKSGAYNPAAVVHDYLYNKHGKVALYDMKGCFSIKIYTRKECDEIFLEAMLALKVPKTKARIMYAAVRTFGQRFWDMTG